MKCKFHSALLVFSVVFVFSWGAQVSSEQSSPSSQSNDTNTKVDRATQEENETAPKIPDPEPSPEPKPEPKPEPSPEPEPKPEPDPEPRPAPKPETKPETRPEPERESAPAPTPRPEPRTETRPSPSTNTTPPPEPSPEPAVVEPISEIESEPEIEIEEDISIEPEPEVTLENLISAFRMIEERIVTMDEYIFTNIMSILLHNEPSAESIHTYSEQPLHDLAKKLSFDQLDEFKMFFDQEEVTLLGDTSELKDKMIAITEMKEDIIQNTLFVKEENEVQQTDVSEQVKSQEKLEDQPGFLANIWTSFSSAIRSLFSFIG